MVVAPESVCPKWMTGALKLKLGGMSGALYPVGAERPGAPAIGHSIRFTRGTYLARIRMVVGTSAAATGLRQKSSA